MMHDMIQGEVTPIHSVHTFATGVKVRSSGQDRFSVPVCHEIFGPLKYFVRGGRKFCNFLSGAAINCSLENKASLHKTVLSFP